MPFRRGVVLVGLWLVLVGVAVGQEPPAGLDAVAIGYFGPDDPEHPLGGDTWLATRMAIDEANEAGGYGGLPFRLVPAWSEAPWGTGVAQLSQSVYGDGLWAIVSTMDGAATHLAEQVVAKARLALLGTASTDKTVNMANVTWMFSCMPADDAHAAVLASALVDRAGDRPFAVVSTTDHDSKLVSVELLRALARLGRSPLHHLQVEPALPRLPMTVERLAATAVDTVVILADPADSARLVLALRERDPELRILGGPSLGRRAFIDNAGSSADGVIFPSACDPAALDGSFGDLFRSRHGRQPDCATMQSYDATRLLVAAIRVAGLDRTRIRDSLRALSPWAGVAGDIEWGPSGGNQRRVVPATVRRGRVNSVEVDP